MDYINQAYQEAVKNDKLRKRKITLRVFIAFIFLTMIAFIMTIESSAFTVPSIVLGILTFISFILFLIIPNVRSEKPIYEIVIRDIVQKIALEKQIMIDYKTYPKDKDYINRSGLFPKGTSKNSRFYLEFSTDDHAQIELTYTNVFTQTQNARYDYLKGMFARINCLNQDIFQIRTKDKPRMKDHQLSKLKLEKHCLIFDEHPTDKHPYLPIFNDLRQQFKHVHIAGHKDEVFIGVEPIFDFKREKEISKDIYQDYYKQVKSAIDLLESISARIAY